MDERSPLVGGKKKGRQGKETKRYYRELDELLNLYEEDDLVIGGHLLNADEEAKTKADNRLSKVVFTANVLLMISKIVATYLSSGTSLAIISTLLDSVVDITSSVGIWYTSYAILHTDNFSYPRGRESLELVAFMFIGVIMGMANLFIMFESANRLVFLQVDPDISVISLAILLGTILTKALLLILCYRLGTPSAQVLCVDQRNDVLTNLAGLVGAVAAKYLSPYADPAVALLIAGYIAITWIGVVIEQLPLLTGKKCTRMEFSRLARIVMKHSDRINCIDTLLAYHTGSKLRVEAHIVLDPMTSSRIVHDEVEEPLKRKLERLSFVDQAFVHPDYECDGYE